jgi:hypothetical protein
MFCSSLQDQITIILLSRSEKYRLEGIQAGAKACCSLGLDSLHEDIYELIFANFTFDSAQGMAVKNKLLTL